MLWFEAPLPSEMFFLRQSVFRLKLWISVGSKVMDPKTDRPTLLSTEPFNKRGLKAAAG